MFDAACPEDAPAGAQARSAGREVFAERFIPGREFNLSLIETETGSRVLPPAEIDFSGLGGDRASIVGYSAKWLPGSHEFENTPRRFDFAPEDRELLDELGRVAVGSWSAFGLAGYARVDFRVDLEGRLFVLEVNANPCLSADAGFMAACGRAGLPPAEAVRLILAAALRARAVRAPSSWKEARCSS